MYLSVVKPDFTNLHVINSLMNEQDMHRNVQSLFQTSRKDGNILYRYLKSSDINRSLICIQSDEQPKSVNGLEVISSINVDDRNKKITENQEIAFDVLVHPTVGKSGKHFVIASYEERLNWFYKQGMKHGFEIKKIQEVSTVNKHLKHDKYTDSTNMIGYHYKGILKVTDLNEFMKVYHTGLGRGKAYGYGMFMLT